MDRSFDGRCASGKLCTVCVRCLYDDTGTYIDIEGQLVTVPYVQFTWTYFTYGSLGHLLQLLKEPNFDFLGISFYVMDACFGMCMLFRMLIILARLVPASDEFVQSIRCYVMYETPLRGYILKVLPTLKRVSAKLTGYSVRPQSVPVGVNVLINWYICAAMWKRPDDPSRRT